MVSAGVRVPHDTSALKQTFWMRPESFCGSCSTLWRPKIRTDKQ